MHKPFLLVVLAFVLNVTAAQTDINGPAGSGFFGTSVVVLPNGNFVVTDPEYDDPLAGADVGAVYLYSGSTFALLSKLKGSNPGTKIGIGGITVLTNGNFVVRSYQWSAPGGNSNVGAVTFCTMTTGCEGIVSISNSLIGSTAGDAVGDTVTPLTNGNYVVNSPDWDLALTSNVGAVTWCSGTTGCSGFVTTANSIVGSTANDRIGIFPGSVALANGNYVARSALWDNGSVQSAGAATWGNGTTGTALTVAAQNSIIGSNTNDGVGGKIVALTNGNYVTTSGSVVGGPPTEGGTIWCNGNGGTVGTVNPGNAATGPTGRITPLTNGNYVMVDPGWTGAGTATAVGAVRWCSGNGGCLGPYSAGNSLIGVITNDSVGDGGITPLTNGHYVVSSPNWNHPIDGRLSLGAATWCSGNGPTTGTVGLGNSITGGSANDFVSGGTINGRGVVALANGNYVVLSPEWNNPMIALPNSYGAATWGNGAVGTTATVVSANSLTGSATNHQIGQSATALTNGNYVVIGMPNNGINTQNNGGSATFCNGSMPTAGPVTSGNSLIGTPTSVIATGGVTALANGNYAVRSPAWDNGSLDQAGAVTFGIGNGGVTGQVSIGNSIVGSSAGDAVGQELSLCTPPVTPLSDGNFIVFSPSWRNVNIVGAGAVTLGRSNGSVVGPINSSNSVLGAVPGDLSCSGTGYDVATQRLFVGRPRSNTLSIFGAAPVIRTPFDFDGDGKTDLAIFRPGPGEWWWLRSSNGSNGAVTFGSGTDIFTPADFTGDGKTDFSTFRPSTGQWFVLRSEDFSFYAFPFGGTGDVPMPADFDGDGKADAAVFRPSTATWYISRSSGGTTIQQFGLTTDLPVAADYDGDGKADIAVYRPTGANGAEWWIAKSGGGTFATQFGLSTDKAVAADYTGDGKGDVAFWRPSTGQWYVLRSEDLTFFAFPFGSSTDVPVPGDYDGDGKTDAAVFRPSNSTWYAQRSTAGTLIQQFGSSGDIPVPNAFVR